METMNTEKAKRSVFIFSTLHRLVWVGLFVLMGCITPPPQVNIIETDDPDVHLIFSKWCTGVMISDTESKIFACRKFDYTTRKYLPTDTEIKLVEGSVVLTLDGGEVDMWIDHGTRQGWIKE